jgi:hypothetical protein
MNNIGCITLKAPRDNSRSAMSSFAPKATPLDALLMHFIVRPELCSSTGPMILDARLYCAVS